VMESALNTFPHLGGNIVSSFSLPKFNDNFSDEVGIAEEGLRKDFEKARDAFAAAL